MNVKREWVSIAAAVVLMLAGCNREEKYQNITEDQLNHYAGIETHDHPVDNATQASDAPVQVQADKPGRQ